jgi:DNA mismatch endonuclease, patch repair protein
MSEPAAPVASSPESLRRMKSQRQRDTAPEIAVRSLLHRRGLRFRVHYPLPVSRRSADIAFPRRQVAVFVDGCFWHGCPEHRTWPKKNAEWWRAKIEANRTRDADTDRALEMAGWTSIRIWEHESPTDVAEAIADIVTASRSGSEAGAGRRRRPASVSERPRPSSSATALRARA